MEWLTVTALRLNEADMMIQYQKFALVVFCAALPLRACIAAWRDRGDVPALIPAAVWLLLVGAFFTLALSSRGWPGYGGAALIGFAVAWIPVPRHWISRGAIALQLPGIVAAMGALFLFTVGVLP